MGHVAGFEPIVDNVKRYSAMAFIFDPVSRASTRMKIIATREDFPDTPAKRPGLKHIVYPGGLVFNADGTADLYAGLSDTSAGVLKIQNPFV